MILHPRSDWQLPTQPVVGPVMNQAAIKQIVIHYTAAPKVDPNTPRYLRAIQNDYTVNRGYSIGYNFAVSQDGHAWQCRGLDIKCAANKGHNEWSVAILVLVDGADPCGPLMVKTIRELVNHIRGLCPGARKIVGHGELMPTGCPGKGVQAQVTAGTFEPVAVPAPSYPYSEDSTMPRLVRASDDAAVMIVDGLDVAWAISQAHIDAQKAAGTVDGTVRVVDRKFYKPCRLIGSEPHYGPDTPANLPGRTKATDFATWDQ